MFKSGTTVRLVRDSDGVLTSSVLRVIAEDDAALTLRVYTDAIKAIYSDRIWGYVLAGPRYLHDTVHVEPDACEEVKLRRNFDGNYECPS